MMKSCIPKSLSAVAITLSLGLLLLIPTMAHAENWALLIGIDKYEDVNRINDLSAASADAKAIAETLKQACGFKEDHIELLVSDGEAKPTRVNILKGLSRLSRNAKQGDTVFVFYSGHGVEIEGDSYLLPYDTGALDDGLLTSTALPAKDFRQSLGKVNTKALILAFDMCRTDPQKSGKDIAAPDNPLSGSLARSLDFKGNAITSSSAPSLVIELLSCRKDERSYEWHDKGRGYFSYFLEQGLRGKAADAEGNVTAELLANYVSKEVARKVESNEHKVQNPLPSLDGNGVEGFILSRSAWRLTNLPRPILTKAQLDVDVNVPGASVAVEGTPVPDGVYATNLLDDPEKTVQITVSAPGYETVTMNVVLHRGKTQQQKVILNLIPSNVANSVVTTVAPKKPQPALVPQYFIQEAEKIADMMESADKARAYSDIFQAQRAAGDLEGARQSLQLIKECIRNARHDLPITNPHGNNGIAVTLTTMAQAQAIIGDRSTAQATIREARAAARSVGNFTSRVSVYTEIAIAQSLNGDSAGARVSIQDAKTTAIKGTQREGRGFCMGVIALAQITMGDLAGARVTVGVAQKAVAEVADPTVKAEALSVIAQALAACGDIAKAKAISENIANIYRKSEAFAGIGKALVIAGDVEGGRAAAARSVGEYCTGDVMTEIAKTQAESGDISAAYDTAAHIMIPGAKMHAYIEIVRIIAQTKNGSKS